MEFTDDDWEYLIQQIARCHCIPYLGAGACFGYLPTGSQLAKDLAKLVDYPWTDHENLMRVSQYAAATSWPVQAKEKILTLLKGSFKAKPNFAATDEPHGVLASLPFPFYLTTNYDDFMVSALANAKRKVTREVCRWNSFVNDLAPGLQVGPGFVPHPATPVVFHLHGYDELPASIVVTEDDYLEFLSNMASHDHDPLPPVIRKAMVGASFLFIGYSLSDWNFRILFQGLRPSGLVPNYAVMVPPTEGSPAQQTAIRRYFDLQYARRMDLRIFWGTARDFCRKLREQWKILNPP